MKFIYALIMLLSLVAFLVLTLQGVDITSTPYAPNGARDIFVVGLAMMAALVVGFWASCQIDSEENPL